MLDRDGLRIPFDNTYARLPARFHAAVEPTHVAAPAIIRVNSELAAELGLDPAALDAGMLSGNRLPAGAEPIAQAYSGHQFGHFSPSLGDGRAILLGEVVDTGGHRRDIQLKGSGPTPFSRGGDGRAALGPVLREYLIGEAMHALGIPTTRALAAVTTGQTVQRETLLPGAVLTRVAASHHPRRHLPVLRRPRGRGRRASASPTTRSPGTTPTAAGDLTAASSTRWSRARPH